MKNRFYLLLMFSIASVAYAQQVEPLLKNQVATKAVPLELQAERARTAEINLDLLGLPKSFALELDLFEDVRYHVAFDRLDRRHPVGDVDVYWGSTGDADWAHLSHYNDVIMTVNRSNEKVMVYAMTSDGMFIVSPTEKKNRYLIYEATTVDWDAAGCSNVDKVMAPDLGDKQLIMSGCEEQDAAGNYVVDMFFSYSHEAELALGDVVAHSVSQAETVNIGLANSFVTNTYLRVVDIAVDDNFVGVYSPALNPNLNLYEDQMEAVGADMIADYQTPNPDVSNAGGWAFVPGRTSINAVGSPNAFRHEWGHNSGSNHCTPGVLPYSSGFDNGNGNNKTHLCGNNINFFSNPRIDDSGGFAIGDATSADNARAIMEERGRVMSGYRTHLVPFDVTDDGSGCPQAIADGAYYLQNVASDNYLTPNNVGNAGDMVIQSSANSANKDIWEVHNIGGGLVQLYNRNRNTTLDRFGSSNSVGNNVGVWVHNNLQANQTWKLSVAASGNYIITSSTSSNVLRINSGEDSNTDPVGQGVADGTDNTEWRFISTTVSPAVVSINLSGTSTSCTSATDGMIISTVTGGTTPYGYNWDDGSSNANLTSIASGTYTVTVTSDGRNYFSTGSIRTSAPLIAEVETTRATTQQGGEINITNVINASGNLTYVWSDGGTASANRTNMPAGDYAVTITDGNGCQEIRKMRVVKTIAAGDYVIQHVPSGLYLENESGQVLLGDCPTDAEQYRWTAVDEGGSIVKFRNNNGLMLTVFGRATSGAEYWTGGDGNVSPHKHNLVPTGADTWTMRNQFQNFFTGTTTDALGGVLIHEDLADPATADEFRFIPIESCTPASGTLCNDNIGSTVGDVFNLICNCCGERILPVSLTHFGGEAVEKINRLNWSTESEQENAGFYLERSTSNVNFIKITWVQGRGNRNEVSNYSYDDEGPLSATNYYRLRQIDIDGSETLSDVITITRPEAQDWAVYPNPIIRGGDLVIWSSAASTGFSLYDVQGAKISASKEMGAGETLRMNLEALPAGVYLLRNETDKSVKRIVKMD